MQNIQLISVSPAVCVDWFLFPYEPAVGACLRIFLTAWVNLFPVLDAAYVIIQSMSSESSPSVYQGAAVFIRHFTSGSTEVRGAVSSHAVLRDDNWERRGVGTWQGVERECHQPLV